MRQLLGIACVIGLLTLGCSNGETERVDIPAVLEDVQASVVSVAHPAGEGSGVIWSSDGLVVTNNHVVEGAQDIEVVLATGERIPATLRASDPLTDLALLELDRNDLPAASFQSSLPRVGAQVVAIGNPLGFENSVTAGIISGIHRAIPSGGTTPALVDLLQTDAAISPGNSGGALVNGSGEVVGINVAYIPPQQSAVSLGFAIPAATVIDTITQLIEDGSAEHAFIGIEPRPITPAIAEQLGLSVDRGILIFRVEPSGPADAADLVAGDVVVEFDGDEVEVIEDLYAALRDHDPGETVELIVVRDGEERQVSIELAAREGP